MGKTAKACSRFGQERCDVPRRGEGAGGAPESKEEQEGAILWDLALSFRCPCAVRVDSVAPQAPSGLRPKLVEFV